ncbi:Uncharacterised protein [Actinobacillus lignieresii]|nr:Uncharacterised protein [Actinobacillus lignieresii]
MHKTLNLIIDALIIVAAFMAALTAGLFIFHHLIFGG